MLQLFQGAHITDLVIGEHQLRYLLQVCADEFAHAFPGSLPNRLLNGGGPLKALRTEKLHNLFLPAFLCRSRDLLRIFTLLNAIAYDLHGLGPLGWMLVQASHHNGTYILRNIILEIQFLQALRHGGYLHVPDLIRDVSLMKRTFTGQELIEGGSHRVDIIGNMGFFAVQLLRTHVGRCA